MKTRAIYTSAFLLFLLLGCNAHPVSTPLSSHQRSSRSNAVPATNASQSFDYYLLNLSWSPEFCYGHPNATECAQHRAFTLHGLWPQNTNGTYPQNCSTAPGPANPSQYSDLYPDPGLLQHEWRTHGTCSGLSSDAYFDLARQAVSSVSIPTELASLNRQVSMTPMQILNLFAKDNPAFPRTSLALSCGNNYLTAIEVCMNKSLQPIACGPIRTCRANAVRIPPP